MGNMASMAVLITLLGSSLGNQPSTGSGNGQPGGCRGRSSEDQVLYRKDRTTVHFDHREYPNLVVASTYLDITDVLMRLHGEDPYRLEKAKVLEETRAARSEIAPRERSERLRESVAHMPAYLEKVWGYTQWSTAERRLALFALWHEVAEDGDEAVVNTGRMVRATIVAFIRRRLPEGSADAYTARELEALNRQRACKAVFEPYAESLR